MQYDAGTDFDFSSFGDVIHIENIVLQRPDLAATNTFDNPYNVAPIAKKVYNIKETKKTAVVPKVIGMY